MTRSKFTHICFHNTCLYMCVETSGKVNKEELFTELLCR